MKTLRLFIVLVLLAALPLTACATDQLIDTSQDSTVIANAGTLVFKGNITLHKGIEVQGGPLTIILLDGAQVQVYGTDGHAAIANNGHSLTIQCEHAGNTAHQCHSGCGFLRAVGGTDSAGIGGCSSTHSPDGTNIIIRSGNIHALGGDDAAGIGGADEGNASNIQILGGTVEAIAGEIEEDELLLRRSGSGLEESGLGAGENGYTTNVKIQNVCAWAGEEAAEASPLHAGQSFASLTNISEQVAGKAFFRSSWPKKVPLTGDAAPLLPAAVLLVLSATVLLIMCRRRPQAN